MKIRGVNLGNWLVLEKWMKPELFAGTDAPDEDTLCRVLGRAELERRLKEHRDTWITEEDFALIAQAGLNLVRLPIPHFLFGDNSVFCDPYVPCIEYVDRAMDWAEKYNLQILLDLHTVPDSANGSDNGGICGVVKWHLKRENLERTLQVLEKIALRYRGRKGLFGIEPVNEPAANEILFKKVLPNYPPYQPERAEGSSPVPLDLLKSFYLKVYDRLRPILGNDPWIVYHDGFVLDQFEGFMAEEKYHRVMLDTHMYVGLGRIYGTVKSEDPRLAYYEELCAYRSQLKRLKKSIPIVVGEFNSIHPLLTSEELKDSTAEEMKYSYMAGVNEELYSWESGGDGWIFWSYCNAVEENKPVWSFRDQYLSGTFPRLG